MLPRRLHALLRKSHAAPPVEVDVRRRDALESELLDRFDRRPADVASSLRPWSTVVHRLAWAAATAMVVVTACRLPVDYALPVGEKLAVLVPVSSRDDVDVEAMGTFLEDTFAPEKLEVEVRIERTLDAGGGESQQGTIRIQFGWVGEAEADDVWRQLSAAFPVVEGARTEVDALEGTVEGTLGGFLSHEMLDIVIDRRGVEAAKAMILENLAARGLEGTARIDVDRGPDGSARRNRVEVRVRAESSDPVGH